MGILHAMLSCLAKLYGSDWKDKGTTEQIILQDLNNFTVDR